MKVEGTRSFAAARETVWAVLSDPRRMAELIPGVEDVVVRDDRRWRANVTIPLALGGIRLKMDFERADERRPDHARLLAKGEGVGALLSLDTSFVLSEQDSGTSMRWEADVRVAGPAGSMGQRVLQPIVNQQVESVLTALDEQVQAASGAMAEPAATDSGTSAAEAGVHPASPGAYETDLAGPTHSTEAPD